MVYAFSQPRLWVIANDSPLPANSGGRVDVWRRLQALHRAGVQLALQAWLDEGRGTHPQDETLAQLHSICDPLRFSLITRSLSEVSRRLLHLAWLPSHAAARWVTASPTALLTAARNFAPDAIWLDGLYGGATAVWLSQQLNKPLIYRSHNIEHHYMRAQFKQASDTKQRLGLLANLVGLERFEKRLIQQAQLVFDISPEDQAWWQQQGYQHVQWLPTLMSEPEAQALSVPTPALYDVIYFGNLRTPNNVDAIRWLCTQVLPLLAEPKLRILLAGSDPCEEVIYLSRQDRRIELQANPIEMAQLVRQGRILVNPVRASSGVNLKSVEMLYTTAVLVSTRSGVQGLSLDAKNCFVVADHPADFAQGIRHGLAHPVSPQHLQQRRAARQAFDAQSVTQTILTELARLIQPTS